MIHIAVSTDKNYATYAGIVMSSVLYHYKGRDSIAFYILGDSLLDVNKEDIRSIMQKGNRNQAEYNINFIEVDEVMPDNLYTSDHITKSAYSRLLLAQILPTSIDKVLYLDCDMLVVDDISTLWNTELQGNLVAAVDDYGILTSSRYLKQKVVQTGIDFSKGYFNSGVLLINLLEWRNTNITDKLIDLCQHNQFRHHDQDALNVVCYDKWVKLDLKWNIIPPVFTMKLKVLKKSSFRRNAIKALQRPGIIHWAGRLKPWNIDSIKGFNDSYWKYIAIISYTNNTTMGIKKVYLMKKSITSYLSRILIKVFSRV